MDLSYKESLWLQKFLTEAGVKGVNKFLAFRFSWRQLSPSLYAPCRQNRKQKHRALQILVRFWGCICLTFCSFTRNCTFTNGENNPIRQIWGGRRGGQWNCCHARPPVWVGSGQWRVWEVRHWTSCLPLRGARLLLYQGGLGKGAWKGFSWPPAAVP